MILRLAAAGAALMLASPAGADNRFDPGDFNKKIAEKRFDCEKKLAEAPNARQYDKVARECDRIIATLRAEQRAEVAKARREARQRWRDRQDD